LLSLRFRSRFFCDFYIFGSVRFRFGKQNFNWLVLFGSGRTVKHCFGRSLVPSIGNIEKAMWVFNCLGRLDRFLAVHTENVCNLNNVSYLWGYFHFQNKYTFIACPSGPTIQQYPWKKPNTLNYPILRGLSQIFSDTSWK
jgi:hypothetical protein